MSNGWILVVDDDPQIRRVMRVTLTGQGYEVDDAKLGEDMPAIGGLETCRAIRVDDVMKPFDPLELLARIHAAWRRTPSAHGPASGRITIGATEIDFDKRRVRRGGQQVRLTPKEFELLRHLVAHANKVLTHRELLQAVWGPDYGDEVDHLRVVVKLKHNLQSLSIC